MYNNILYLLLYARIIGTHHSGYLAVANYHLENCVFYPYCKISSNIQYKYADVLLSLFADDRNYYIHLDEKEREREPERARK